MPFKDKDGNLLETCDVSGIYKEWKEAPSVRLVALRQDRLFESSKPRVPKGEEKVGIKFNIKDAVHNQFVLKPLLERMSEHDHHPVPYVKDLAREIKLFRNKMSLIPQKDKVKLDAWTTKSMLSFVKMKTHKNLGSHDLHFLALQRILDPNIQPYNQWDPDAAESDGYAESGADDDGLIHDAGDFEQESEVDEWFDQFVKSASEDSVAPTELEPETPKPSAPAVANKGKVVSCLRPVARPLCHAGQSSGSDVLMIEESPVKLELCADPDEQANQEKEEKVKKMEALREELRRLEVQMERAASVQRGISAELEASEKLVTVDESLPMARDSDPTIPMDLSSGMSASVEGLLRNEIENSMESDGENEKTKVLTRREQLGLAADMKAEKEEQKGKGKGKGRAGGRGRGRGRGKVGVDPSKVAEPETTPEKPKPSKRAPVPVDTPERRELFPEPPAPVASSPAVKQPKKRIRGKGKAKVAMPEEPAESHEPVHEPVPDPVGEKAAPKQKAKSRAKPKAKPSAADPADPADPADASTTKERKIGKATQKTALDLLKGMKGSDEAGWYHAKELHKALKYHKLSDRREVPKWDFWSLSMYWGTGRVGVLQKHHQKGFTHIISFGGVHVKNIAMSAHAARMFINFMGGDKPPEKLKAISNSEVIAYGESLQELVKAIGVADCLGMGLDDI